MARYTGKGTSGETGPLGDDNTGLEFASDRDDDYSGVGGGVSGGDGGGIDAAIGLADASGGTTSRSDGGDAGSDDDYYRDPSGNYKYNADGTRRKKRRRRGTGTSTSKPSRNETLPVATLARFLMFTHATIANVVQTPELDINENEATILAKPLSELASMYGVEVDPKVMAWMELAGAASYVYGPRIFMIRQRLMAEARAKKATEEQQTDDIIPTGDKNVTTVNGIDPFVDMTGLARGPLSNKIN